MKKPLDGLIKSWETLLWSWGSDTPPEVFWGLNEQVKWINEKYNVSLPDFEEDWSMSDIVVDALKNLNHTLLPNKGDKYQAPNGDVLEYEGECRNGNIHLKIGPGSFIEVTIEQFRKYKIPSL